MGTWVGAQWGRGLKVVGYVLGIFINAVFISQDMLLVICKFFVVCAEERERRG